MRTVLVLIILMSAGLVTSGLAGAEAFDNTDAAKRPHITASGVDELLALYKN